jgi:hypothetical protein
MRQRTLVAEDTVAATSSGSAGLVTDVGLIKESLGFALRFTAAAASRPATQEISIQVSDAARAFVVSPGLPVFAERLQFGVNRQIGQGLAENELRAEEERPDRIIPASSGRMQCLPDELQPELNLA